VRVNSLENDLPWQELSDPVPIAIAPVSVIAVLSAPAATTSLRRL
jgi:hypothetical protein